MLSLALLGTSVSLTGCGSSSKKAENGELNMFYLDRICSGFRDQ